METTLQLYEAARAAAGVQSDNKFAKQLGLSRAAISKWRNKGGTFDDDTAEKIADILGRGPGEIIAICNAQRAKDEAGRKRWLRIAALLAAMAGGAAPGAGAAGLTLHNENYGAHSLALGGDNLYIMRKGRRRRWAVLCDWFTTIWHYPALQFA